MTSFEFWARYNELSIAEEAAWQERSEAFSKSVKFPCAENVDAFVSASLKWTAARKAMPDFITLPHLVLTSTSDSCVSSISQNPSASL